MGEGTTAGQSREAKGLGERKTKRIPGLGRKATGVGEKNRREWEEKQRAWEEKSRKELWEREQVWNEELEKKQRVWEDQKWQEQEARKRDLDKTKRELGNQVQEVRQAQQQQQQLVDSLAKENEQLMQRVAQLGQYNDELEEKMRKAQVPAPVMPEREGAGALSGTRLTGPPNPQGSPHGSTVHTKKHGPVIPSPVIDARPLGNTQGEKFQFTQPKSKGILESQSAYKKQGPTQAVLRDRGSHAGSDISGGTIRRGINIIKDHAPDNVYQPIRSNGKGRGYHAPVAQAGPGWGARANPPIPTRVTGRGMDNFHNGAQGVSSSRDGSQGLHYTCPVPNGYRDCQWGNNYPGGQGSRDNSRCSSPRNPFECASQAEGDLSIPSVYSEPSYEQGEEEDYGAYQDSGYYQPSHSFHNESQQGSQGSHHSFRAKGRNNQGNQHFPYQDYRYEGANENGVPGGVVGNGGYPPQDNQGGYPNHRGQQPYQGGRGNHGAPYNGFPPRANNRGPGFPYGNQHHGDQNVPLRDPKLSKYDGKIPWCAYEVKLKHMAQKYQWDDNTKLAKLVEALDDKALTFFSNLSPKVQGNFEVVRRKMNNRFSLLAGAIRAMKNHATGFSAN